MPNLPVNIDTSYADSPQDASFKTHQQHHDVIHGYLNGQSVSVKEYGVKGDGVTDDTVAIQAALDAAAAHLSGAELFFPAGVYIVSAPLVMGDNTIIRGVPFASVIRAVYAGSGAQCILKNDWANGNTGLGFQDITFDRSGAYGEHGILLNGVDGLYTRGLRIVGVPSVTSGGMGISSIGPPTRLESKNLDIEMHVSNGVNFGLQLGYVTNAVVRGTFDDCYREAIGIEPEAGNFARNISVLGAACTTGATDASSSQTGVVVVTESSGGTIEGVSIMGVTVRNTNAVAGNINNAFTVLGGKGVVFSGCVAQGMNGTGFTIGNALFPTDGVVLNGNAVLDCSAGGLAQSRGILLSNATHTLVTGNVVKGSNHQASVREESGAANNTIVGNEFYDTTPYSGISATSLVAGNHVADSDALFRMVSGATVGPLLNPLFTIDGTGLRRVQWSTSGVARWWATANSDTESGLNVGSNFELAARTDAGASLGVAMKIFRDTRRVVFPSGMGVGNSAAATTPGSVTKKIQVFDVNGASLGYVAVYDAIT